MTLKVQVIILKVYFKLKVKIFKYPFNSVIWSDVQYMWYSPKGLKIYQYKIMKNKSSRMSAMAYMTVKYVDVWRVGQFGSSRKEAPWDSLLQYVQCCPGHINHQHDEAAVFWDTSFWSDRTTGHQHYLWFITCTES